MHSPFMLFPIRVNRKITDDLKICQRPRHGARESQSTMLEGRDTYLVCEATLPSLLLLHS